MSKNLPRMGANLLFLAAFYLTSGGLFKNTFIFGIMELLAIYLHTPLPAVTYKIILFSSIGVKPVS